MKNLFFAVAVFFPFFSLAETSVFDNPLGCGITTLPVLVKTAIGVAVKIGIPLSVLAIVYTGFIFVTALGDPKKIEAGKKALLWTCVGTGVLLGSWLLSTAFMDVLTNLMGGTPQDVSGGNCGTSGGGNSGAGGTTKLGDGTNTPPTVTCTATSCLAAGSSTFSSSYWQINGVPQSAAPGVSPLSLSGYAPGTYSLQFFGIPADSGSAISSVPVTFVIPSLSQTAGTLTISCPKTVVAGTSATCTGTYSNGQLSSGYWIVNGIKQAGSENKVSYTWDKVPAGKFDVQLAGVDSSTQKDILSNTVNVVASQKYFDTSKRKIVGAYSTMGWLSPFVEKSFSEIKEFCNAVLFNTTDTNTIKKNLINSNGTVPVFGLFGSLANPSTGAMYPDYVEKASAIAQTISENYSGPVIFEIDEPFWGVRGVCDKGVQSACDDVILGFPKMLQQLDILAKTIRTIIPGAGFFHVEAYAELIKDKEKFGHAIFMSDAEYLGFDCYGDVNNCNGHPETDYYQWTLDELNALESKNPIGRKIILVPGAFTDPHMFPTAEKALTQFNAFMSFYDSHPNLGGIGVFVWGNIPAEKIVGFNNVPELKAAVESALKSRK